MFINTKFYVITVASIFIALGIGIYVGFMLDAQEILIHQKQDIVASLEERFDYIRAENQKMKLKIDKLEKQISNYEEFSNTVLPAIIRNKLNGIKVTIIETSDDYIYSGLVQTLEKSGAKVVSTITFKDSFINKLENYTNNTDNNLLNNFKTKSEKKDVKKIIIEELMKELTEDQSKQLINSLVENDFIDIFGNYKTGADYVIITGGYIEADNYINLKNYIKEIINYCKKNDIPVIGVEKENVKRSYISVYKEERIPSIDNVDSVIGKASLILTMTGKPGNYGIKNTADTLMPSYIY
ncbi:copper transporter [Thermohalobacter berrensis]|uniref:Copper transporter n=1 Tax=Thermohalobacter berrensis TaxID=99594 RepID=A0A419TAT1_9FIRM|nr:copper transporter [Thermohalobacter berrensis]RKD34557.1 hypothetical protein BET03_01645 [Thermohalobacter berrensis]